MKAEPSCVAARRSGAAGRAAVRQQAAVRLIAMVEQTVIVAQSKRQPIRALQPRHATPRRAAPATCRTRRATQAAPAAAAAAAAAAVAATAEEAQAVALTNTAVPACGRLTTQCHADPILNLPFLP
eukprot:356454-Chlamydomonas_euryale.AAC.4